MRSWEVLGGVVELKLEILVDLGMRR